MELLDGLSRRIHEFRDEMIDFQIKLCAQPAIDPGSQGEGEGKKAEILLDFLSQSGYSEIKSINAPDLDAPLGYRPNILALYKGKSSAKTIWIMTHMDIVPPGDLGLWNGNPFKAWVEEGKIFGRGVEDNQQDMVASLFALKAFQAEGILPNYDVGIALVSDEETGSEKGLEYVLKQKNNPFRKQDLIIVPDAGNKDGTIIEVAEKGLLWLKFITTGKQAHGSTPEKGINAMRATSYLIVELDKLYKIFDASDSLFDPPTSTFEPSKKEPNVLNINTIPGEDIFFMDIRVLPRYKLDQVEEAIREIMEKIERKFEVKIRIQKIQRAPAAPPTPADASIVFALKKAISAVYGKPARAIGIGGGTVAALFRRAGFQAAVWSRMDETAHQPNEYCIIDNMVGDAEVFAHIFLQE